MSAIDNQLEQADIKLGRTLSAEFRKMNTQYTALMTKLKYKDGLLVRDVANAARARKLLLELNRQMGPAMRRLYKAEIDGLKKVLKVILNESKSLGIPATFLDVTKGEAKAFMEGVGKDMTLEFQGAVNEANDLVRSSISGTLDFEMSSKAVAKKLDIRLGQAQSLASSSLMNFQRTILSTHAEEHGIKWFAYEGPQSGGNIRPYCQAMVGKRFTAKQLENTAGMYGRNPGLVPVSKWLGGYRCRHRLIPLVDDEDVKRYSIGPKG